MPKYLDIFNVEGDSSYTEFKENILNNNYVHHVSQAKELKNKHKCKKSLKRKLKKYKLSRDGIEDKGVLDVSQSLKVSLTIRSPNKQTVCDFIRPDNYLMKMVKRKQASKTKQNIINCDESSNHSVLRNIVDNNSQDKQQTNAFQLLMDGRNKSIGSNSPGKEKISDELQTAEAVEKRDCKVKRMLVLQKMADAKGALKRKELEKLEDECIRDKMEKRGERLKAMIVNPSGKKSIEQKSSHSEARVPDIVPDIQTSDSQTPDVKKDVPLKSFSIIDMFGSIKDNVNSSPRKKSLLKEDEEFLKKLSPSIKKKENMLCYFNKVEKDTEIYNDEQDEEDSNQLIIKVKFTPKRKVKKKSKLKSGDGAKTITIDSIKPEVTVDKTGDKLATDSKKYSTEDLTMLSVNTSKAEDKTTAHIPVVEDVDETPNDGVGGNKKGPRKRKINIAKPVTVELKDDSRPKRTARKPIKYSDDVFLTSSDEELHTFTPKKQKKQQESNNLLKNKEKSLVKTRNLRESKVTMTVKSSKDNLKDNTLTINKVNKVKEEIKVLEVKKPSKLAPIFNNKSQSSEDIEAKIKFLQSGVPEKLKKITTSNKVHENTQNNFATVVHVLQYEKDSIEVPLLCKLNDNITVENKVHIPNGSLKLMLNLDSIDTRTTAFLSKCNIKQTLHNIKESYPKFPVYRTYHSLKAKSKGDLKDCKYLDLDNSVEVINHIPDVKSESPDKVMWTDKYKPFTSSQIIGNFESVKELRKWLVTWTENDDKLKSSNGNNSDSSDFYMSDTDSKDGMKLSKNMLIISGPTGTGKTSAVYAVAAELAIKVIEVNASSRRTGKIMLQDLQEATQSHKVNRGKGSSQENSQKSQSQNLFNSQSKVGMKKGRKKKESDSQIPKLSLSQEVTSSQDSTRTCMSLILIDDADVVFDQDDGFCSAISQLVHCSKRPVILVTQSLSCPHLQRFLQGGKIIKMNALVPRMLGTWLDIMCLADTGTCRLGMGAKILDHFKGDIRKTINYLQYYMATKVTTIESCLSQNSDVFTPNIDDESSSMSWNDKDFGDEQLANNNKSRTKYLNEHHTIPLDEFDVWWNLPHIFKDKQSSNEENNKTKSRIPSNLDSIANALLSFSVCDYISNTASKSRFHVASDPWHTSVIDSVDETENFDAFDSSSCISEDICGDLVKSSVSELRRIFNDEKNEQDLEPPTMADFRKRESIVNRHNSLTSFLSPSAILDRRALALDYWPSCRTICRTEKSKSDNNSRRNNRFCHYLKSQNLLCNSESFDILCDSLLPSSSKD